MVVGRHPTVLPNLGLPLPPDFVAANNDCDQRFHLAGLWTLLRRTMTVISGLIWPEKVCNSVLFVVVVVVFALPYRCFVTF